MWNFIWRLIPSNFLITFGLIVIMSINYNKVKSFEVNTDGITTSTKTPTGLYNSNNNDDDDNINYINKSNIPFNPLKDSNFFNKKYPSTADDDGDDDNRYQEVRNSIDNDDDKNNDGYGDRMDKNEEEILSRERRYLIFPEGSSLQVVFDQIVPIVDYTNYLILGITVALAWELPSKKPSEMFADLYEKLNAEELATRKEEKTENNYKNEEQIQNNNYISPHDDDIDRNYNFNYHNSYSNYDSYQNSNPYYRYKSNKPMNWNRYQLSEAGFHPPMELNYYYTNHGNFIDRFDHLNHPATYENSTWNRYSINNFRKSNPNTHYSWGKSPSTSWQKTSNK